MSLLSSVGDIASGLFNFSKTASSGIVGVGTNIVKSISTSNVVQSVGKTTFSINNFFKQGAQVISNQSSALLKYVPQNFAASGFVGTGYVQGAALAQQIKAASNSGGGIFGTLNNFFDTAKSALDNTLNLSNKVIGLKNTVQDFFGKPQNSIPAANMEGSGGLFSIVLPSSQDNVNNTLADALNSFRDSIRSLPSGLSSIIGNGAGNTPQTTVDLSAGTKTTIYIAIGALLIFALFSRKRA